MCNFALVSLIFAPQRTRSAASVHAAILLGLALLITACTDGGNVTVSNGGAVTPAPTPAPTPTPVPPPPTSFTLTVTKTGVGTITSSPGGITCGTTCSNSYVGNTNVTLTAAPASGNTFSGWSGACAGAATTCVLAMTVNRSVSGTFVAGGTAGVIFQDDFSSGNILKTLNGAAFWINGSDDARDAYATKPSDIFVQAEDAGGFSLRVLYAGTPNPLGDAKPQLNFELGGVYPELWVSFRVYIPQNYFHREPTGTGNNKFFIIDNNIGTQYFDFEVWPRRDGSDRVSFQSSYNGVGQGHIFPPNDWTLGAPEDRGQWHNYILHLKLATSATANNGLVQAWKNGVLVMDFQGLPHHTPAANYFGRGYIFGAANSGFNEDTELRLDDVVFSNSPP